MTTVFQFLTKNCVRLAKEYGRLSFFGQALVWVVALLLVMVLCRPLTGTQREGMTSASKFEFKEGNGVYDDFYADIYDYLVFNPMKNEFEVSEILKSTSPNAQSVIADIGCGTGHHVHHLADEQHLNVTGVDLSPAMVAKAREKYPSLQYKVGDAMDARLFQDQSLTHVTCLYFTLYYMKDKLRFFNHCHSWLMPGGYLVVHLADREKFDPILPPGNPLYIVSPQKYAKERITKTKITFNDFVYESNFDLTKEVATFHEKFKFKDGTMRKHAQTLYMEDTSTIVNYALEAGFTLHAKIDMVKCAYENQYLYVFVKS